jgi:hypothetical protein
MSKVTQFTPNASIEADIQALQNNIIANRKIINDEGTWLFLTTLGCWSVTNYYFQWVACLITLVLFIIRVKNKQEKVIVMHVKQSIEHIKSRISELPKGDTQKARLLDLYHLQEAETKTIPVT